MHEEPAGSYSDRLRRWYETHHQFVMNVARDRLRRNPRCPATPEDVCQSVYRRTLRAKPDLPSVPEKVRAYLVTAVERVLIEKGRRRRPVRLTTTTAESARSAGPAPHTRAEFTESASRVREAVARIGDPREREYLDRKLAGAEHAQIAADMGLDPLQADAVRKRAMRRLAPFLVRARDEGEPGSDGP